MVVHLVVLRVLLAAAGASFVGAQSTATATAMVWNYFLNNTLTYRDYRLVGWAALRGLASFMVICGLGAVVNVLVARDLYVMTQMWCLCGGMRNRSRCAPQLCAYFDVYLGSASVVTGVRRTFVATRDWGIVARF